MFRHSTKLILAGLTTAAVVATAGCSRKSDNQGSAAVGVHALSLAGDVKSMTVSVSGTGIPGPMVMPLFKQADGNWKALVNHIPAGSARTFAAKAFDATQHQIYSGSAANVTIQKDQVADVTIVLQEDLKNNGFANHAPVIDSLTVSSTSVVYGDKVAYTLTAHDQDVGDSISFAPNPSCGSFAAPTITTDAQGHTVWAALWTAPGAPATSCQLNMTVTDSHGAQAMAAVTITVSAGVDVGGARVATLVESYPVIANVTANPTVIASPAGTTTVSVDTTADPDGNPVTYAWTVSGCTGSFDDSTKQSPLFTLTQTPAPASCTFGVTVSGPTRTSTNGTPQTLSTSGSLTVNVGTTQVIAGIGGVVIDLTSQSQETANGGDVVTLFVQAHETNPVANLASYTWTPSNGSVTGTQIDGAGESTSQVKWTAPAVMGPSETVTLLLTDSQGATASYVFTFKAANDPCAPANSNGVACSDGNPCTLNDTCQNHVCVPGTPKSCAAIDQCHKDGVCDQTTGQCSVPAWGDGHACNDGDACTQIDKCVAGVCTGTSPVTCQAQDFCHAAGTCDSANGTCSNPTANEGVACTTNTDLCALTSTCQSGSCTGATFKACTTPGTCHTATGASCLAGTCIYPNALDGSSCSDGNLCTGVNGADSCQGGACVPGTLVTTCPVTDLCHVASNCDPQLGCAAGSLKTCSWGTSCQLSTGNCAATCPAPHYAQSFGVTSIAGLGVDATGAQYITATMFNTVNFGSGNVTSAGSADLAVAKLDPTTGLATWTSVFGDASDQVAVNLAVAKSGRVGVIGNFTGGMTVGPSSITNSNPSPVDFIVGLDTAGTGLWADKVDTLSGALLSIGSNLARDEFVVCGYTKGMVKNFGTLNGSGLATSDTLPDILIAKIDSTSGNVIWARQIGGAGTQACSAVTMDSQGNVFATGYYNTTGTAVSFTMDPGVVLPGFPSTVLGVWVAQLNSAGTVIKAKSFGGVGKQYSKGIALDSAGDVIITGNMKSTLTFTGTPVLTSAGGTDGFLAKLDSNLVPLWSKNWGDANDQEAHSVAVSSVDEIVVVGLLNGDAVLGSTTLHTNGVVATDAYWAKFNGSDGSVVCAANYGDAAGQSADLVAISSAAPGTTAAPGQKDMVNLAGFGSGTISFAPGISITTATANGFVLQLNP
jgi:hypothetical protein